MSILPTRSLSSTAQEHLDDTLDVYELLNVVKVSSDQTLTDSANYLVDASAAARTITLPNTASLAASGFYVVRIKRLGGNDVTISCQGSDKLEPAGLNLTSMKLTVPGATVTLAAVSGDTTWYRLMEAGNGVRKVTSTVTADPSDALLLVDSTSAAVTVNLPALANVEGMTLMVKRIAGSNSVTIDPDGTEVIKTDASSASTRTLGSIGASWSGVAQSDAWYTLGEHGTVT